MAAVKEKAAIELVEQAFHLLRQAPVSLLLAYYVGALPYLLAVLFFWTDMAHSGFAAANCAPESLGVAVLYLWLSFWQAVFAHGLRQRLRGSPPDAWTPARIWRTGYLQALVQSSKLFLLPVALVALVPLAPAFALYQSAAVLASGAPDLRTLVSQSARQAGFQSRQNWMMVPILLLFALFVFFNLTITLFLIPHLFKMLFGVESTFTRSGVHLLNSTLFATAAGLAWAAVDPLIKTVYVLRCFYGESVTTGNDLQAAIVNLRRLATLACLLLMLSPAIHAQGAIPPKDLDRSIDQVIHRPAYTWRMPRDAAPNNASHTLVETVADALARALDRLGEWMANALEWLRDLFREKPRPGDPARGDLRPSQKLRWLLYALIAALALAVAILLLRYWLGKRTAKPVAARATALPVADLTDDSIEADKVPEDRWLAFAQDLIARGDLRLAVRAFYLASLSYLARRSLVIVQAAKTNRQYETELQRRTRDRADVARLFSENARVFERAWYGDHEVSAPIIETFRDNLQRMKACAEG
jgi:hypothetical protein